MNEKKKLVKLKTKLNKEKDQYKLQMIQKYSINNREHHKRMLIQMIIYTIFLILTVAVVVNQLNLIECYREKQVGMSIQHIPFKMPSRYNDFSSQSSEGIVDKYIKFDNIFETPLISDWFANYLDTFQKRNFAYLYKNYFIGDPFCRILVRKLKNHTNDDTHTNEILPSYISNTDYDISSNLGEEADTSNIYLNGNLLSYTPYGNSTSPNHADGYLAYLYRNTSSKLSKIALSDYNLVSANWIHQVFQMFLINKNTGFYSRHEIVFKKLASGELLNTITVISTSQKYETAFDYFRLSLELILVIMNSWYLYRILKSLFLILLKIESESLGKQSDELKANKIVFRVLWFDKNKYMNESTFTGLVICLYRVIVTLIRIFYHFLFAVYKYTSSSIFNILDITSTILIIVNVSTWIQIVTIDIFVLDNEGRSPGEFNSIETTLNLISKYEIVVSISITVFEVV